MVHVRVEHTRKRPECRMNQQRSSGQLFPESVVESRRTIWCAYTDQTYSICSAK